MVLMIYIGLTLIYPVIMALDRWVDSKRNKVCLCYQEDGTFYVPFDGDHRADYVVCINY